MRGGWLMEYFIWSCGAWSVLEKYKVWLKDDEDIWRDDIERETSFDKILSSCIQPFVGWLLLHVASVGTNGREQLFYITFMNNYFGLSRTGMDANAKFGMGVTTDMFDTLRRYHLNMSTQLISYKKSLPHALWWDNFSKFFANNVPTVMKDIFSSCLWTGVTVNEYSGPHVSIDVVHDDESGDIVPAMPANIMLYKQDVNNTINECYRGDCSRFSESLVYCYAINSIPLTIDVKKFPQMKQQITSETNSTKYIHPSNLIQQNIGSNRGLLYILRKFQEDHKMHYQDVCDKYHTLNVDENIYYRILKVNIDINMYIYIIDLSCKKTVIINGIYWN